jgi:pimeloyl-ACP methyl ester carboxylesterase
MDIDKNEAVVLFHGLGLHAFFMRRISAFLKKDGYDVCNIDYPSRRDTIERMTVHLYNLLEEKKLDGYKSVHFIGHSLGGVLVRNLLYRYRFHNQGKVIALAPPNKGSVLVDIFKGYAPVRWYFGPAFLELGSGSVFLEQLAYIPDNYYVIAGNRSKGTLFGFLFNEVNDGAVSVEDSIAEGMIRSHHSVLPVTHFTILYNKKVIDKILEVLK